MTGRIDVICQLAANVYLRHPLETRLCRQLGELSLRDLLSLSDRGLVQKIHELEKYGAEDDATLKRFSAIRSDLSYMAWTSFSDAWSAMRVRSRRQA